MKLSEIITTLNLSTLAGLVDDHAEVTGGFCSDLLSDVMGHSREGNAWITIQVHKNIIAVAALKELSAIILVNGLIPPTDTIETANNQGVVILGTQLPAFEVAGRLYAMLS